MANLKTIGIVGASVSSVGAASGLSAHYLLASSTIEQLLDEKYIILDINDTTDTARHWNKAWGQYKEKNKSATNAGADMWKLSDWRGYSSASTISTQFKNKCGEYRTKKVSGKKDPAYEQFVSFCTRVATIEDQLKKDGLTPLGESSNKWTQNVKKTADLKNLGITISAGSSISADTLKQKCTEVKTKNKDKADFATVYAAYKEVCAEQKE